MKIAYATDFDVLSIKDRSTHHPKAVGQRERCYYAAKALEGESTTVQYLGPLIKKQALLPKLKWRFYRYLLQKNYQAWAEPSINQYYNSQILEKISRLDSDVILAPDGHLLAYLDCKLPTVLWTDTPYVGLINAYSDYSNLCQETVDHLMKMDQLALTKCRLALFSSEWSAKLATETYNIAPSKVKVVPFGANLECDRSLDDIKGFIEARPVNQCKLLFWGQIGIEKGGDIALSVASELQKMGVNVELTIVGCQPVIEGSIPDFLISRGFISKSTSEGLSKINSLIAESHFLILPSRAEAYGQVFCEANSFGVPCISTKTGGITTIIQDGLNGKTFSLGASIAEYSEYIYEVFSDYLQYKQLALSSFNEYQTRLNWSTAGQTVKKLLMEVV